MREGINTYRTKKGNPYRKKRKDNVVGFEVLTAAVMKSSSMWNITLCSPLEVNPRVGGTFHLHLQVASRA
jgi:hypothetical protein